MLIFLYTHNTIAMVYKNIKKIKKIILIFGIICFISQINYSKQIISNDNNIVQKIEKVEEKEQNRQPKNNFLEQNDKNNNKNKENNINENKKEKFEIKKSINEIQSEDKHIGVALGGGSAKGLAHIGILKVMEEEKVPIEYITGTSMGSIIGGLYASGYTAKEIEKISIEMDWLTLFSDQIDRRDKGITRNLIEDRNSITLPIEGFVPKLPSGAIGGKSASEKLNDLFYGVLDITDFKKLPRKFAAVGTDLNSGNGVMIDKGSIATAIRSSLSLPSIFNAMAVDDKLYIDGGVTRNLPVQDVKVLGADYTIGINVGEGFEKRDPTKLNIIGVVSDAMTIAGRQEVERQIRMLDMYMAPDLAGIESQDFMKVKEIIAMGEKIARNNIDEIRKLSNPKKYDEIEKKRIEFRNNWKNEYNIKNVIIKGNKKYNTEYFNKYIPKTLGKMNKSDMENIVNELYRNGNFSTVYYEITDNENLVINVQEKAGNYLSTSTNINNENYATVSIGIQGNKTLVNNIDTKYDLKTIFGNEYGINGLAIMSFGKNNRILTIGKFQFKRDIIKNQYFKGNKYEFENKKFKTSLGIGFEVNRNTMFLLSGGYQISNVSKNIIEDENKKVKFPYFEASILHDSRDYIMFPTKGNYLKVDYTFANSKEANFESLYAKGEVNIPITSKITISPSISYIKSDGNKIPETYRPKLGGFSDKDYSLEFGGIPANKIRDNSIFTGKVRLQYQFSRYLFADVNASMARLSDKSYDFGKYKRDSYGVGIGASLPIGSLYLGLAKTPNESVRYFFNIGYEPKAFNEE